MNYPLLWATEVVDFLKNARDKGLETAESRQILVSLTKSGIFTPTEKDVISAQITRKYPSIVELLVQGERDNE